MPPLRADQAESLATVQLPKYPATFTTTCSALHVGSSVVLLGDSGHSCLNGLGQGCNVALESARVLDTVLRQHRGNLATALPAFSVRAWDESKTESISRTPHPSPVQRRLPDG